jgi:transposase InsO family protein
MSDNASAMLAAETTEGLARLSIVHGTTLPYAPFQNGKQESFWNGIEHRYVSNVLDAENSSLLLMIEGRSAEALGAFAKALVEHRGEPSQIEAIAMDMSRAYVKGATQYFPHARIVFDKFHVMVLAGQALEEVRRELQREGADLKVRCGPCAATLGTSVRSVKSNVKISLVNTLNLAAR